MRLATLRTGAGHRAVRLDDDGTGVLLAARDVGDLLSRKDASALASDDGERVDIDLTMLAPVVPKPAKVFVVGLNFPDPDLAPTAPDHPSIFAKFARSLCGPRDPLFLPDPTLSVESDYEVEPVVVIGKHGRHIPPESARDHIAGYCVGNDASVRDWQFRNRPPLVGKAWEQMSPIGPWLTTADSVDLSEQHMKCEIDGATMQSGPVGEMFFSPERIVSYISTFITLEPGDLIFLGTPPGHAYGRPDKPWLRAGQTVRTAITGLGELINMCLIDPVRYRRQQEGVSRV